MNMFRMGLICISTMAALAAGLPAQAQVVVNGTRHIFPGNQREITVRVQNVGQRPSLVQVWTDAGNANQAPDSAATPFMVGPPVFRLDGGKSQALRVMHSGAALPQDRESVYWLNVLDAPPMPDADEAPSGNYLQFSLRTRVKLIYRPVGLNAVTSAPMQLQWTLRQDGDSWSLQAANPTPYYVHFANVGLRSGGKSYPVKELGGMVAPMATKQFPLQGAPVRIAEGNVQFQYMTDLGGVAAQSTALQAD